MQSEESDRNRDHSKLTALPAQFLHLVKVIAVQVHNYPTNSGQQACKQQYLGQDSHIRHVQCALVIKFNQERVKLLLINCVNYGLS